MYNTKIVAQMVKDLPAIWKTWVQFLSWEGPLEEGMATHFQYSYLETLHGERSLVGYSPQGHEELHVTERLSTAQQKIM